MLTRLAAKRTLDTLARGYAATATVPTLEDVVWTQIVDATVDAPNTLRPTTAVFWSGGACSTRAIVSGAGYMEWTVDDITPVRLAGLSKGNSGQGYQEIDFGAYAGNGLFWSAESDVWTSLAAIIPGDVLRVAVDAAGVVTFLQNGVLRRTSPVAAEWPLLVDASLGIAPATIVGAKIYGLLGASGF